MRKTFTITAVVPNYNYSAYLIERLESILGQTCGDLSVIILDDCSTDNSREIIESYRHDDRIKAIVYNEENGGSPFKQWVKGIELADSDLVWIAESDDSCSVEMIGTLMDAFIKDEKCVMSFCRSQLIDCDGNRNGHHPFQAEADESIILPGNDFIRSHMLKSNLVLNASSVLFRRSAFENISREFLDYRYKGDVVFWCEIARNGNVHYIPDDLNYHRRHKLSQTITGNNQANRIKTIREDHMLLDYFLSHNDISRYEYTMEAVGKLFYGRKSSEEEGKMHMAEYPQKYIWLLAWLKGFKDKLLA